ncbi:hypothetical protein GCM10023068_43730 [Leifsonia shinshuensis]
MEEQYSPRYTRLDAFESAAAQAAGAVLQHAFDRLTSLIESGRTVVSNASGSTLERDDELTPYNPISYQLAYFALVSVDHLRFVRDAISTRQDLAVMAEYSVIRSAIEASAYAVWLATGVLASSESRIHSGCPGIRQATPPR